MSRTIAHNPKTKITKGIKNKRPNNLGICNCVQCKAGRRGKKDSSIIKIKNKSRLWWNNKPEQFGAYTD